MPRFPENPFQKHPKKKKKKLMFELKESKNTYEQLQQEKKLKTLSLLLL